MAAAPPPHTLPARLLQGLHETASKDANVPADLEKCFYSPVSGLFSEGNWHNAIMGYSLLKLGGSHRASASLLACSLYKLNGDDESGLFRYRTHSPYWSHAGHIGKYHEQSVQKRCASQCACVWLWSMLRDEPTFDRQYQALCKGFVAVFWNPQRKLWRTTEGEEGYYRAVDSALALLALLRMRNAARPADELTAEAIGALIHSTREALLKTFAFTVPFDAANGYVGKPGPPVLWQDLWIFLALHVTDAAADSHERIAHWRAIEKKFKSATPHVPCSGAPGSVTYVNDVFFYILCARIAHKIDPHALNATELNTVTEAIDAYVSKCLSAPLHAPGPVLLAERAGHHKHALHPATEGIFFGVFDVADFAPPAAKSGL